jgi:hypothetical protein
MNNFGSLNRAGYQPLNKEGFCPLTREIWGFNTFTNGYRYL